MAQCIYYKNRMGLTFNKREHIFQKQLEVLNDLMRGLYPTKQMNFLQIILK